MTRGGARINSGPPPDPNAVRRRRPSDQAGWTTLPTKRAGRIPKWPLLPDIHLRAKRSVAADQLADLECKADGASGRDAATLTRRIESLREKLVVLDFQIDEQTQREQALWRWAWRTPQANAWDADPGCARTVAMWVRHQTLAELGSMDDDKEARQLSDRLGLSPAAMQRLRWKVATDEVAARSRPTLTQVTDSTRRPGTSARDRLKAAGGGA